MKTLMIVDRTPSIHRLKEIAARLNIHVVETYNSMQVISRLRAMPGEIDMVIIDVLMDGEDGFQLVEDIKREAPHLPVLILTALNTRKDFIKGLKMGATDYILKPFDDNIIQNRLMRMINDQGADKKVADSIDFKKYLEVEIIKSKKGKYPLSVCMMVFLSPSDPTGYKIQREYDIVTERVFSQIRSIFFDTDVCIPYGNHTILTVLPFCSKDNVSLIHNKIDDKGNLILSSMNMDSYKMISSFVTVPVDGENLDILISKLYHEITNKVHIEQTESFNNESQLGQHDFKTERLSSNFHHQTAHDILSDEDLSDSISNPQNTATHLKK